MYNKKSSAAASKYTQSLYSETGPKSKKSGGDEPKGRSLKAAIQPKSATLEIYKMHPTEDRFISKKAEYTDSEGRAMEDWGNSLDNESGKNRVYAEFDANGNRYGQESRTASARKAVDAANRKFQESREYKGRSLKAATAMTTSFATTKRDNLVVQEAASKNKKEQRRKEIYKKVDSQNKRKK